MYKLLKNKYKQSSPEVDIVDRLTISNFLRKRLSSKEQRLLKDVENVLYIKIHKNDKSKQVIHKSDIVKAVNDAITGIIKTLRNAINVAVENLKKSGTDRNTVIDEVVAAVSKMKV